MGITCWTICEDCDEEAPELGDCGFIGYPSLEDNVPGVRAATFGSIYNALAAIHVVTGEIEAFRRFLERHEGHRVVTDTEGGSPFGDDAMGEEDDEEVEDYFSEDDGLDDEDHPESEEMDDEDDEDDDDDADWDEDNDDEVDDGTVTGHYQATCTKCDVSFLAKESDRFVPFERATIRADDMTRYERNVVSVMDESSYRAEPLYGDLENLARFFKKHLKHEVVVELVV